MGDWAMLRSALSVPTTSENQESLAPQRPKVEGNFQNWGGPQAKNLKKLFL